MEKRVTPKRHSVEPRTQDEAPEPTLAHKKGPPSWAGALRPHAATRDPCPTSADPDTWWCVLPKMVFLEKSLGSSETTNVPSTPGTATLRAVWKLHVSIWFHVKRTPEWLCAQGVRVPGDLQGTRQGCQRLPGAEDGGGAGHAPWCFLPLWTAPLEEDQAHTASDVPRT